MNPLTAEVRRVSVVVPDGIGRLSGKTVTAAEFERVMDGGLAMPNFHLVTDYTNAPAPGLSAPGAPEGFGNGVLRPDMSTFRVLPWDSASAIVLADAYDDSGRRESCAPRTVLSSQVQHLREKGLVVSVATELEFYLLDCSADAMISCADPTAALSRSADHDLLGLAAYEPFVHEVMDVMEKLGFPAEACHGEGGVGQVEIAFPHGDPIEVADRHILYKYVVKRMARERGMTATFMAQPFQHQAGSSCHIHLSLWRGEESLLVDRAGSLTRAGAAALQALLELTAPSTMVHAPNINSYRRLQPGSWAPSKVDWGYDDRTRLVRILGAGGSGRFEFRLPGADCNPYLSIATLIASMRRGLEGDWTDQGQPSAGPGDVVIAPECPLPRDLGEAVQQFAASEKLPALLGPDVFGHLAARSSAELTASRSAVTDWERRRLADIA